MRTAPVHPTARLALREFVVATARAWLKLWLYGVLGYRPELPVAGCAAGPRRERRCEPVQHIAQLIVRVSAVNVRAGP
jgi:hypothetical protein